MFLFESHLHGIAEPKRECSLIPLFMQVRMFKQLDTRSVEILPICMWLFFANWEEKRSGKSRTIFRER